MKKILPLLILTPTLANAECTPAPDCASIGYTETYCETKSVKCPFDTSKLFCVPCDSSYQYTCSGENIIGGVGSSCGGKYASCECSSTDYIFSNGSCVCDTSCKVGAIYYSDGSCSSCVDTTKTAVGIVVKDNELIASLDLVLKQWSINNINIEELTEPADENEAKIDMSGMENTRAIVNYYGVDTNPDTNAAVYCYNYAPSGMEHTKNQWYLPASGELYTYMGGDKYNIFYSIWNKFGVVVDNAIFSSTEAAYHYAWALHTTGKISTFGCGKTGTKLVSCFLAIG